MHFWKSQNEIYDIGTKILNLQCFNFPQNQLFCKSIIFSGICSIFCALYDGSIKTWFKAIWDIFFENLHATLDSQVTFFMDFCPRRATVATEQNMIMLTKRIFVNNQVFLFCVISYSPPKCDFWEPLQGKSSLKINSSS